MEMKDGKTVDLDVIEHFITSGDHRSDPNAAVILVDYFMYRELQEIKELLKGYINSVTASQVIKKPVAEKHKI